MKKFLVLTLLFAITLLGAFEGVGFAAEQTRNYKASYTIDAKTGYVIDGYEIDRKLPIASMVKIMTALLGFEAIESGKLSLDQVVTISENASGMGGSQMFLESGDEYTVEQLLKGIIVVSANDGCVQLAETICGSEDEFVKKMNEKARSLGMVNTVFVNCTGLPASGQYSTAHDVSIMLRELIKFPKYHELSKVWIEDFIHPDGRITQFVNTNKLVRFYKDCTGGKTGFTSEAGFCLAASAKKGETELISVVIGASDSKTRFGTVTKGLDYGFANYETKNVLTKESINETITVLGGKSNDVKVYPEKPYFDFVKKGQNFEGEIIVNLPSELKAPIKQGQIVGTVVIKTHKGEEIINLLAESDVMAKGYFDTTKNIVANW